MCRRVGALGDENDTGSFFLFLLVFLPLVQLILFHNGRWYVSNIVIFHGGTRFVAASPSLNKIPTCPASLGGLGRLLIFRLFIATDRLNGANQSPKAISSPLSSSGYPTSTAIDVAGCRNTRFVGCFPPSDRATQQSGIAQR